ncbi:RagB/SusD family nutrient uptake outer membrane protein [Flavisolibacter ginsenosidimutans]|uniref:RagB/SusD family nutrient uptake outer membrane protein n=1 Tax=Flavisolibacter ginsenosidimutans TaxID=661481 RepID=A0A5B8UL18_9BACT|nr:RagB/SusD family nutrient uptake outer membrane protein [Flavisolibacter ginsenosidimutans]QEC57136.1 RagB/SusD family nutrient uptake outer membrane protein [Flavisolibacter ginsenosidimutans]
MNRIKISVLIFLCVALLGSCKKSLDIKNPNQPTPESANTESGIEALAQGGVYINGFRDLKYGDGVFGLYWSGAMAFHELMADVIQAEAANSFLNQIGVPNKVILSSGQVLLNPNAPNRQIDLVRAVNINSNQGSNFTYYEWAYMYAMNNAMNTVLSIVDKVPFTGNAASKKAAIIAWAHFWKGYAYSRIGSIYYAGLIVNTPNETNGNYVTKEQMITAANSEYDQAATALSSVTSASDYSTVLTALIPQFNRVGNGGVLTADQWKHTINTLKARNILVNKTVSQMTAADWNQILTLTSNGITSTDKIFTGRSNANGDFLASSGSGTVSGRTQSNAIGGNTYKVSERWVQDFKPGDKRKDNNLKQGSPWIGNVDRGQAFNTRWTLVNGGNGLPGVKVYANTAVGAYELPLAGSYEENELMKAEALIYTSQINQGLQSIDAVRTYQGAGLAPVAGTGLTQAQAVAELRSERRVALPFLGLSFYDARRWGRIYPIAQGGGRTPAVVVKNDGSVDNNATIEYDFLDYWDVPDNELAYNPAATGSAPTKNPK